MARFCARCGTMLISGNKFCTNCGAAVPQPMESTPPPAVNAPQPVEPPLGHSPYIPYTPVVSWETPATIQPAKPKKKWHIVIAAVAAILALAIVIAALPSSPSSGEQPLYAPSGNGGADTTQTLLPPASTNPSVENQDAEVVVPADGVSRTIMIYIVASNLESENGAASVDIQEMINANIDTQNTTVLICTGGTVKWENSTIAADKHGVYKLTQDGIVEVQSSASQNMGQSGTLTAFLEFGQQNYAADKYSLILWDHGGGPMMGYGHDEIYNDILDMSEMVRALENSPFGKNRKLEFLGFDACLMASVETAWAFRDYAEYFVASEETEPGFGWNYMFLEELGTCNSGKDVGRRIIDSYFAYYEELVDTYPYFETDMTLSCVDLSKIGEVERCVDELFANINQSVLAGHIGDISRCRYKSKAFGKANTSNDYDLIDLTHMAKLLSEEAYPQATALENALNNYVTYSRTNVDNAYGASIYHPYDNIARANQWIRQYEQFGFASKYTDYIGNFTDHIVQNGNSTVNYRNFSQKKGMAQASGQASDLSIQLTAEQVETFSGAQYYIFYKLPAATTFSGEEEYLHIFSGQDATLSTEGTLSATYEGKAVFGKDGQSGEYSSMPLSMKQIYDGTGEENFYFPCMFWQFGEELDMDVQAVNWLMKIKNGKPTLLGAYSMDAEDENLFPDKYLMDSNDYDLYTFANNSYTTVQNEKGNVEFVFSGSSYGFEYQKEAGFDLELRPIEDKENYYAVFVVEDIYGNTYNSEFFSLGK